MVPEEEVMASRGQDSLEASPPAGQVGGSDECHMFHPDNLYVFPVTQELEESEEGMEMVALTQHRGKWDRLDQSSHLGTHYQRVSHQTLYS